jgi:hypothetical protein
MRIKRVRKGDFFGVARFPTVFSETYFLDRGLAGKWGSGGLVVMASPVKESS